MTDDSGYRVVTLSREVDAILIPNGIPINLQEGSVVTITQQLGDSITVHVYGNLARIEGSDADALGLELELSEEVELSGTLEEQVWAKLKTCFDPEIPVDIVELGLIYECDIQETNQVGEASALEEGVRVNIKMTLTAPGCGMGPVIAMDVKQKVLSLPLVAEVDVEVVFDPPWDQSLMSDAAKLQLGLL